MSLPLPLPRKTLALACLVCVAGAMLSMAIDANWSASIRGWDLPGDLRKGIHLSEVFGHSLGAAGILLAVYWIAVERRRAVWGAICLTAAAGLTANLSKGIVARVRPHSVESFAAERQSNGMTGGGAEQAAAPPAKFWDSRQRSFPSGHAATACGLAIGLGCVFPRGVPLFAFFAALACLQRVYSGAHYPSDVCAGAAIALAWGWLFLSIPRLRGLFTIDESAVMLPHTHFQRGVKQ